MTISDDVPVRDAATVIVLRRDAGGARILMGQRGSRAVFMPNKFVFPGGAVDAEDADVPLVAPIAAPCHERLAEQAPDGLQHALTVAAIRELWEETGLILGAAGAWGEAPAPDWEGFARTGFRPDASALRYVFRAITPPGRPRRFDARFFLVTADHIQGDLDDFSGASEELSHLQWVPLTEARKLDLPFITEVVLAEIAALVGQEGAPASVPFFHNGAEESLFLRLGGQSPLDQI